MPELPEGFEVVSSPKSSAPPIPEGFSVVKPTTDAISTEEPAVPYPDVPPTSEIPGYNGPVSNPVAPTAPEKPARSLGEVATGIGEAGLTALTGSTAGALSSIQGTINGIIKEAVAGNFGTQEAADRIEQLTMQQAQNVTYQPRTEAGREYAAALGKVSEPLAALTPISAELSGAMTTASKAVRPSRKFTPEIDKSLGSEITPKQVSPKNVPGAKSIDDVDFAMEMGGKSREFAMNPQSPEFAEFVLKGGQLTTDPIARQAIKQGIDPGFVSMIKTAGPATKRKMAAMLNIIKRGKKDLRYQDKFRPIDILGSSVADRIKYISKENKKAGKDLSTAVKDLSGKTVNYTDAYDSFVNGLGDLGVVFEKSETGRLVPNFDSSVFSAAKPKSMIKNILQRFGKNGDVDARQAHIDKKFIDELVNWGKNETGSAGQVEGLAKRLRGNVNSEIGKVSKAYRTANEKYSDTKDLLDRFVKSSGAKLSVGDEGYSRAAGVGMRRTLSNAPSGAALRQVVDDIEAVSKKYGGKFNDDLNDQTSFAIQLDRKFGPSAKTSLGGEQAAAVDRGAEVLLGQKTMYGAAAETGMEALKKARGINEDNAFKALDSLVRTNYVME